MGEVRRRGKRRRRVRVREESESETNTISTVVGLPDNYSGRLLAFLGGVFLCGGVTRDVKTLLLFHSNSQDGNVLGKTKGVRGNKP